MSPTKKKPVLQLIIWGVISLIIYLLIFLNQEFITKHYTNGSTMAVIAVIASALTVSILYGNFANYLLDLFGIRPVQKH